MVNSKNCECGCGQPIIPRHYTKNGVLNITKFIHSHNNRLLIKKKICFNCKKEYKVGGEIKKKPRKFCSLSCASAYNQKDGSWNRGIPHTEDHKIKIGEGVKRTRPKDWVNPSCRPEVKEKIKNTLKQKGICKGVNNPNWKGGICPINIRLRSQYKHEIASWRKQVFERDNYACKFPNCGKTKVYLQAHHIKKVVRFPQFILYINNGITLCRECHNKTKGREELFENTFSELLQHG